MKPQDRIRRFMAAIIAACILLPWAGHGQEAPGTPSGMSAEAFLSGAEELLEQSVGKETLGAAFVVFSDEGILSARGFGHADTAGERKVSPRETIFEYGSVTKVFVWLLALRLWQEGALDLSRDISVYLPPEDAARLVPSHPVTMLDLMNHRAGFEENPLDMMLEEGEPQPSLREALLGAVPAQRYQPGTVSAYSNYGCALAAYVVERVSGQSFRAYVQEHILAPLGMASCAFEAGMPGSAEGSVAAEEGGMAPVDPSRVRLFPSGGLSGTAEDLAALGSALLAQDSRLFSNRAAYAKLFTDSYAPAPGLDGMAHGLFTMNARMGKGYQHAGNTNGFTAQLVLAPERRLGYALLCNTAYVNHLGRALSHLLMGEATVPQHLAGDAPPSGSGYFVSGRNAFERPFYSLLSCANAYHLSVQGDEAVLTSALLRVLAAFGVDDLRLIARRASGALYQVTNRPELVETLYVAHENGRIRSLWSDGNQLIPLGMTPRGSYPLVLGSAVLMLLIMAGFFLSLLSEGIGRLYRLARGRGQRPAAPLLMALTGAGMSLSYLLGLSYVASSEAPYSRQLNGYTAGICAFSVAALCVLLYHVLRGRLGGFERPVRRAFILRAALAAVLAALFLVWGQYRFV